MNRTRMAGLIGAAALSTVATLTTTGAQATGPSPAPGDDTAPLVGEQGVVTARGGLASRVAPSTHTAKVGHFARGRRITINCKIEGTNVDGNRRWYLVLTRDRREWVSARYVRNVGRIPDHCDPSDGFYRPRTTARLNKRQGPSAADRRLGTFRAGDVVLAQCFTRDLAGRRWIHTGADHWVSARYVEPVPGLRYCRN